MKKKYLLFILSLMVTVQGQASLFTDPKLVDHVARLENDLMRVTQQLEAMHFALEKDRLALVKQQGDKKVEEAAVQTALKSMKSYTKDIDHQLSLLKIEEKTHVQKHQVDIEDIQKRLVALESILESLVHHIEDHQKKWLEVSTQDNRLFNQGLKAFKEKNWFLSVRIFNSIVIAYPLSDHWVDSLYWLGMSFFKQKEYLSARESLSKVVTLFPQHKKAPTALFQVILCDQFLEDNRLSADMDRLLTTYRATEPAQKALSLGWSIQEHSTKGHTGEYSSD